MKMERLFCQFEYQAFLIKSKLNHKKFEDMTQSFPGKVIIDKIAMDFELINSFRTIGTQLPPISYVDHVELRVLVKEMEDMEIPY